MSEDVVWPDSPTYVLAYVVRLLSSPLCTLYDSGVYLTHLGAIGCGQEIDFSCVHGMFITITNDEERGFVLPCLQLSFSVLVRASVCCMCACLGVVGVGSCLIRKSILLL